MGSAIYPSTAFADQKTCVRYPSTDIADDTKLVHYILFHVAIILVAKKCVKI